MNSEGITPKLMKEYIIKISILCHPDNALTKSLHSYADGKFESGTKDSLGIDLPTKKVRIDDIVFVLFLADISTHPGFDSLRPNHFRDSSAAIFAFSKSNFSFLESAKSLYYEFRQHIPHPAVPITLIGLHQVLITFLFKLTTVKILDVHNFSDQLITVNTPGEYA